MPEWQPLLRAYLYASNQGGPTTIHNLILTQLTQPAQLAEGTKKILENFFDGKPQEKGNVIVDGGKYITPNYGQRK
ncbi:hypothetical protein RSAG8_05467, partial [Rhizoctonia solani AG-8 WAC10335]